MKRKRILLAVILVVVMIPVSALALVKPLRVIVPEIVPGVSCYEGSICTDNKDRLGESRALYDAAFIQAQVKVGSFHSRPRVTFCSTIHCLGSFGGTQAAARTFGTLGIVVAPRGWQEFYIAHEFIHYRQAEELGMLRVRSKPKWLIEGMAYSLSGDPRRPLTQPLESWREQFETWYSTHRGDDLWSTARGVK